MEIENTTIQNILVLGILFFGVFWYSNMKLFDWIEFWFLMWTRLEEMTEADATVVDIGCWSFLTRASDVHAKTFWCLNHWGLKVFYNENCVSSWSVLFIDPISYINIHLDNNTLMTQRLDDCLLAWSVHIGSKRHIQCFMVYLLVYVIIRCLEAPY